MSLVRIALVMLVLSLMPLSARADTRADEAAREFDRAAELFKRGEFRRAALGFTRAFELSPHADSAYNAALSWEEANEPVRAAESYRDAIYRGLGGEARSDAKARLSRLSAGLGQLKVSAADAAVVRVGDRAREAPADFFVEPGAQVVVVIGRDGRRRTRDVVVEAGAELEVHFNRESAVADARPARPRSRPSERTIWPALGWSGVVAGGVLAGVAVFLGIEATSARDDFNASDRTDLAERDHALALRNWTRVAWASAAVVGGSGIAILLIADDTSGTSSALALPSGAAIRARF